LGVYRVKEITNEKFVANAIQVEMRCCHFYTLCHVIKAINAIAAYRAEHRIVNIDMV
jgi:hypothetical protein